jgi:GT2 family glycosyltransferase
MTLPKVAISYLTYNGKDSYVDITRCFKSIQQLDYPLDRVEIICVENPSPHGASWPFIEKEWGPLAGNAFPKLTIEKNAKDLGFSGAENVGMRIAAEHGCDYVFLLNQDADVDPGFLKAAVQRAEADPKVMFVQSLLLLGQDKNRVNSIGNRYHYLGHGYAGGYGWTKERALAWLEREKSTNPDLEVPYFSGAAVLVRIAMAKRIGLFDTPFYMYHEDVDASFNARVHGWKTVIEPSSVVYHYYAFSRSIKKFYWMERNRLLVNLSYYKLPTLVLLAFPFFGVEVASLFFSMRSGWWREKLRSWAFFLRPSTWRWVWTRRRRIMRERVIGDRAFLKWAESKKPRTTQKWRRRWRITQSHWQKKPLARFVHKRAALYCFTVVGKTV